MKKILVLLFLVLSTSNLSSLLAETTTANQEGSITGVVNHCDKGGIAGMMIYIPGQPHLVITGSNGKFQFDHVAVGDYTLYFMINGSIMNFNKWVEVQAGKTSKIGEVSFCDKMTATTSPANRPGAIETPANLQTHCDNEKDGTFVSVINGRGVCHKGAVVIQQCNKGFSDCDKLTGNGCETDIMNDDENCGACFNTCGDTESCQLGFC